MESSFLAIMIARIVIQLVSNHRAIRIVLAALLFVLNTTILLFGGARHVLNWALHVIHLAFVQLPRVPLLNAFSAVQILSLIHIVLTRD